MNTRKTSIVNYVCLALIILLGSVITYFAMNLFWSDIANAEMGFNFPIIFSTLPMLMLALMCITFAFFMVRYLSSAPEHKKHMAKHYSIIFIAYSGVGLIAAILSGCISYHFDFLMPCPFPGSIIVYIVTHLMLLGVSIGLLVITNRNITEEDVKNKTTHKYRIYTAAMALFAFIAFDRCGAALASPGYIEWNRLDLTWFFYLSLLMPMTVLVIFVLFKMNYLKSLSIKTRIIIWGSLSLVILGFALATMLTAFNNPLLVSLISPAMPVERLATIPVDFVLLYVPAFALSIVELINNILNK